MSRKVNFAPETNWYSVSLNRYGVNCLELFRTDCLTGPEGTPARFDCGNVHSMLESRDRKEATFTLGCDTVDMFY